MKPIFFPAPSHFRKWLEKNHNRKSELLVGFYRVGSGKPTITWPESVDQALCFGWIDGVRRSIDDESYSIRFTPRRLNSNWSEININKMKELIRAGLMTPAGQKVFDNRKVNNARPYSYEKLPDTLSASYEKLFKRNKVAWNYFNLQPPSYKKMIIHWIMSAKQEKTQLARLDKTIMACEKHKRIT